MIRVDELSYLMMMMMMMTAGILEHHCLIPHHTE
jgi:hypothetical protein